MTTGHECSVVPVWRREYSEQLTVDVAHVVAYRTACACGWRGPSRATVQRARNDYTLHEHEHAHAKAGA